jgi:hypothetical protein
MAGCGAAGAPLGQWLQAIEFAQPVGRETLRRLALRNGIGRLPAVNT